MLWITNVSTPTVQEYNIWFQNLKIKIRKMIKWSMGMGARALTGLMARGHGAYEGP